MRPVLLNIVKAGRGSSRCNPLKGIEAIATREAGGVLANFTFLDSRCNPLKGIEAIATRAEVVSALVRTGYSRCNPLKGIEAIATAEELEEELARDESLELQSPEGD